MTDNFIKKSPSGPVLFRQHSDAGPPSPFNDRSRGFTVFSEWIDLTGAPTSYICVDDTPGAAIWQQFSPAVAAFSPAKIRRASLAVVIPGGVSTDIDWNTPSPQLAPFNFPFPVGPTTDLVLPENANYIIQVGICLQVGVAPLTSIDVSLFRDAAILDEFTAQSLAVPAGQFISCTLVSTIDGIGGNTIHVEVSPSAGCTVTTQGDGLTWISAIKVPFL